MHPSLISHNDQPPQAFDEAVKLASHYHIGLVANNLCYGSGVLIESNGSKGILTAFHVAKVLFENAKDHQIGFIVADNWHRLSISLDHIRRFDLGTPSEPNENIGSDVWRNGPDLCFLELLDKNVIDVIASKRSFHVIKGEHLSYLDEFDWKQLMWITFGTPSVFEIPKDRGTEVSFFFGNPEYISCQTEESYQTVEFRVPFGKYGFPADLGGCSGGGLWVAIPILDEYDENFFDLKLFLAGINTYQDAPIGDSRVLVCCGPHYIYSKLDSLSGSI